MSKNKPLVSISCVTYNHAPYLRQCLDGFFIQKCDFEYEILLHDDASTDGSQEIVREYMEKYPGIIKPIFQTQNQYSQGVRSMSMTFNAPRAQGKYIAICESDDYWTDPLKLQKQVEFLEKNPQINICCHPSYRLYGDECKKNGYGFWGDSVKIISAEQVIINYITSPSQALVFRNENTEEVGNIIKKLLGGHSTLQIFYAMPNGIGYLPDYMAVYRVGSTSSVSKTLFKKDKDYLKRQLKNLQGLKLLNEHSKYKFNKSFQKSIRLRTLGYIQSGFLSWNQIFYLIYKYQLLKEYKSLIPTLNAQLYNKTIKFFKTAITYE